MRFFAASLAVLSAAPVILPVVSIADEKAVGPIAARPYSLDDAVESMVMDDVTIVTLSGRCATDRAYPTMGRFVPDRTGRAALHSAGLDDGQSQKFLAAACSSLPAFTVNLASGVSIIGSEPRALAYVAREDIGRFAGDVRNDPEAQRANIMAHERGHAYFNSEGFAQVFDASTSAANMVAQGFGAHWSPNWLYLNELRHPSPVDELVADGFMICDAAAAGRPAAQTDIFMNWRAGEPSMSGIYKNADVLTPEFIGTLQAACAPLGPHASGPLLMEKTVRTFLAGPWNYMLK